MCTALGGRAAEKIIFNKISTGALSDLEKVTKQAYSMVSVYGLSDKVGNISFYDSSGRESFNKPYSESTAKLIDDEVSKLVEDCYQETLKLLKNIKANSLNSLNYFLDKEVIFKEDLLAIFGPRPWDKEEIKDEKSNPKKRKAKSKKDEPKQVDNAVEDK